MSAPLSPKQKNDFYCMIIFMKIAADYAEMLIKDAKVERVGKQLLILGSLKQTAKMMLKDVHLLNNNMIMRFRNALQSQEGKALFDAEWQKDYLAWSEIFQCMAQMNPEGIAMVENFCQGLLRGEVRIELEEVPDPETCEHKDVDAFRHDESYCRDCGQTI